MSRCFPYAPLGERNAGEPPIGSIKLQKERKHAEERKKRREKKEKKEKKYKINEVKQAREGTVLQEYRISSEHGEQVHKKIKYDTRCDLPYEKNDDCNQAGKCRVEQLEGSGLSEEHGLPYFIPEPSESSESTQNSSKSRKLEGAAAAAAARSHGGTILRFKLPPKKHNDPEPIPSSALPGFKLPLKKHKDLETVPSTALHDIKLPSVPSSALPGPKLQSKKHKYTEPVPTSALTGLKSQSKRHKDTELVPTSLPGLKLQSKKHKDIEPVLTNTQPGPKLQSKKHKGTEAVPTNALPGLKLQSKKHKDTALAPTSALPGLKCKDTRAVPFSGEVCTENRVPEYPPSNEEPCFSGRTSELPMHKEADEAGRRHSSSRSSKRRRSEETESQLRDLLSSLNPAPMQFSMFCDDEDQGWLFGSSPKQHKDPGATKTKDDDNSVAEGLGCKTSAMSSYQPVACLMPEFDCYRLPYVFPY